VCVRHYSEGCPGFPDLSLVGVSTSRSPMGAVEPASWRFAQTPRPHPHPPIGACVWGRRPQTRDQDESWGDPWGEGNRYKSDCSHPERHRIKFEKIKISYLVQFFAIGAQSGTANQTDFATVLFFKYSVLQGTLPLVYIANGIFFYSFLQNSS